MEDGVSEELGAFAGFTEVDCCKVVSGSDDEVPFVVIAAGEGAL